MAERGVVARRRPDGGYDLLRSRWGGTDRALAAVFAGLTPDALPGADWRRWRTDVCFRTLLGRLDYLATSVCYRVCEETTAFLVCWFGLPLPAESAHRNVGALVAVRSLSDARTLRRRFRALKGDLADAVAAGAIPITAAPAVILAWFERLDDRERHLSPWFGQPPRVEKR